MPNKDQAQGLGNQAKGAMKEAAGRAMADRDMEARGKGEKAAGKMQKGIGDAKEKVKRAIDRM